MDRRKVYHSEEQCDDISTDDTDQNGCQFPDSFSKMIQYRYNSQCQNSDQPILPGTIIFAAYPSGHIVNGSRIQRKSNCKYNGSSDQRREKFADLPDKKSHKNIAAKMVATSYSAAMDCILGT